MGFIINPYWFVSSTPPGDDYENYYSNEFDGTDDYIDLGRVEPSTTALSISFWVYVTSSSTSQGLVTKYSSTDYGVTIWGGALYFFIKTASWDSISVANFLSSYSNQWVHVCCTWDGSTRKIYLNGSEEATGSKTGSITYASNNTRVGNLEGAAGFQFGGFMDELSFYDTGLSASDVTAIYNSGVPDDLSSTSNLKEWYRMGDGANYPIVKNQAHFSQEAINFDGSNDTVGINKISGLTGDATISFWTKWQAQTAQYRGIFSSDSYYCSTKSNNFSLQWYNGNTGTPQLRMVMCNGTTCDILLSTPSLTVGNWYHIAYVLDASGNTVQPYLNGSALGSALSTTNTFQGLEDGGRISGYKASCNATVNNPMIGQVDDLSIYNSALSGSDITDIYNSGYPKDESERSGLVAYYKFDGDVYPVVRDAMQFSNASLVFDGTNDYVTMGDVLPFERDEAFSISAWVYLTNTSTTTTFFIAGKFQNSGNYSGYALYAYNYKLHFVLRGNSDMVATSAANLTPNQWHHILGTYDGSDTSSGIKTYINGSLDVASQTGSTGISILSNTPFIIGSRAGGSLPFQGNIDDVIVFNAELSASDVTDIYNSGKPKDESSTSNVLGYWRMGDNTISPNVPSALGYGTHSLSFDGVDNYVDIGAMSSIHSQSAITVSAWIKPASLGDFEGIVSQRQSTSDFTPAIELLLGGSGAGANTGLFVRVNDTSDGYGYTASSLLSTGTWYHVAMVFDGSLTGNANRLKLYLNGVQKTLTFGGTIPATTPTPATNMVIGKQIHGSGEYFNGNIHEVSIFDSALSASDVTSIYNSGLPKDISSESGLVSYYRMGDGEDKYPNILDYKGTNHGIMTNMAADDITTDNIGSGAMTNMASDNIVADTPAGTSGQMTNMATDDFVAAKGAGTMTNMDAEDIVADVPS